MSESKKSEDFAPRASNVELTLIRGPASAPRTFTFSSPHNYFVRQLNSIMALLPELLGRLQEEEEEIYGEGQTVRLTAVSTTCVESDDVILCDCSAGAIVISLFSATKAGRTLIIVKVDSTANAVTVSAYGNDLIEGSPSKSLTSQYDKTILLANGVSEWLDLGTSTV